MSSDWGKSVALRSEGFKMIAPTHYSQVQHGSDTGGCTVVHNLVDGFGENLKFMIEL
jgi:hypothetical protein